ncbi:hypothetical protein SNEBB_009251 [Seison nebaliae]|nr:hypothetical protein SNEBB_009251 [Seison nebaliae]
MELPHIGKYCSYKYCRQLDFTPAICKACKKTFCMEHLSYEKHQCPEQYQIDRTVPFCPICNEAVNVKDNETADLAVNRHIEQGCKKSDKKMSNIQPCSVKRCRNENKIRVECEVCHKKFCIEHRHPMDHKCGTNHSNNTTNRQLISDEELARQLQESEYSNNSNSYQPTSNSFSSNIPKETCTCQ